MIDAETKEKLAVLHRLSPPTTTRSADALLGYLIAIRDALKGFYAVSALVHDNDKPASPNDARLTFAIGALGGTLERLREEVEAAYEAARARYKAEPSA